MDSIFTKTQTAGIIAVGALVAAMYAQMGHQTNERRKADLHFIDAAQHAPVDCFKIPVDSIYTGKHEGTVVIDRRTPGTITQYIDDPHLSIERKVMRVGKEIQYFIISAAKIEELSGFHLVDGTADYSHLNVPGRSGGQMGKNSAIGNVYVAEYERTKCACVNK